jgi:hypothetical protein
MKSPEGRSPGRFVSKDRGGLLGDSAKEFIGQADGAIAIQESSAKSRPFACLFPRQRSSIIASYSPFKDKSWKNVRARQKKRDF